MRAVVAAEYGGPDVLEIEDRPTPEPANDQALVRVMASSLNPYDWHTMTGLPKLGRLSLGLRRPKHPVLGADFAGVIEAIGSDVEGWSVGDEVYGQKAANAWAEHLTIGQQWLVRRPASVSFEEAAAIPLAATTALQAMRDRLQVQPGQKILVNGASGGVGHFVVQIAAGMGAEVTGVCSTRNVEMVRSLGAARVIDYTQEDLRDVSHRFDGIFDLIGNHPVRVWRRLLADDGTYVASHGQPEKEWLGPIGWLLRMKLVAIATRTRMQSFLSKASADDWRRLAAMVDAGDLEVVLDERRFPLDRVPDAMRHLEGWHARGKVAITV